MEENRRQGAIPLSERYQKRLSRLSGGEWHFPSGTLDNETCLAFSSLEQAFVCDGEFITNSPISEVRRVLLDGRVYYVKKYWRRGKYLRRFLGRSRARAEWENLLFFQSLGIGVPNIIACGESGVGVCLNKNYHGLMVTEEIADTDDLANMARRNVLAGQSSQWVKQLSAQVAGIVSRLHAWRFFHNDLKFRNILVTQGHVPEVFMIDCPAGRRFPGRLVDRYKVKDLACLDKVARYHFSRTQRLRFFKMYRDKDRLDASDKEFVRKVLLFFEGRE